MRNWRLTLAAEALKGTVDFQPHQQNECLAFIVDRLESLLREQGYAYDVVAAVLAEQGHIPARAVKAVQQLAAWVARPEWRTILPAYARCVRITRDQNNRFTLNNELFSQSAEKELAAKLQEARSQSRSPGNVDDFFKVFNPLIPAINRFFDEVMVMVEDVPIRQNRLALLQGIVSLADGVADFSRLEGF